jgi:hypothetical protein
VVRTGPNVPVIRRLLLICMALLLLLGSAPPALAWCAYPGDPECPAQEEELPPGVTDVTATVRFIKDRTVCDMPKVVERYNRLYIQLRSFASCLGLKVDWDEQGQFARIWGSISPDRHGHLILRPNDPIVEDRERVDTFHRPTGQERLREHWDLEKLEPIIVENRMMIPFRFITDYWDLKVDWVANPDGDGLNEVRVTELDRAIAVEVDDALKYISIGADGRFTVSHPYAWQALPAARRWVEWAVLVGNGEIDALRSDYGAGVPRANPALGRVEITSEWGSVHLYRAHRVLWFHDGSALESYVKSLQDETSVQKLVGIVVGGGLAAKLPLVGAIAPYVTVGVATYKAVDAIVKHLDYQRHETCKNTAASIWYTKTGSFKGYTVGFVYGQDGFRCLTAYTADAIAP